jgi:hypothetical protein
MSKSQYNPNRQDKPRKAFNSKPVFTETCKEISEKERSDAAARLEKLKKDTRDSL